MVTMRVVADVPENRQVTLTLPAEVPAGRQELLVTVGPETGLGHHFTVEVDPALVRRAYPPRPTHPKLAREFNAFQALLPELLKSHRGQYVAIQDGQVVASGPDKLEVARQAYDRCGYQAIYVALVTDEPQPVLRTGLCREDQPGRDA